MNNEHLSLVYKQTYMLQMKLFTFQSLYGLLPVKFYDLYSGIYLKGGINFIL